MPDILSLEKNELLQLSPEKVDQELSPKEILHIFKKLDGFWGYDHSAAEHGKPGYHALLKSGNHSDGFLNSRSVLKYENICRIMAKQLVKIWEKKDLPSPSKVAGIPTGATSLGKNVAEILGVESVGISKIVGYIKLMESLSSSDSLLLIEDFCTKGTGFQEAINDILCFCPGANILPFELVLINRGGLTTIETGYGKFHIITPVEKKINDWDPEDCPLCNDYNSVPIKPKETEENWVLLNNSQK